MNSSTPGRIVIAGGSGFLGLKIRDMLKAQGKEVKILTRSRNTGDFLQWDGKTAGEWKSKRVICLLELIIKGLVLENTDFSR